LFDIARARAVHSFQGAIFCGVKGIAGFLPYGGFSTETWCQQARQTGQHMQHAWPVCDKKPRLDPLELAATYDNPSSRCRKMRIDKTSRNSRRPLTSKLATLQRQRAVTQPPLAMIWCAQEAGAAINFNRIGLAFAA